MHPRKILALFLCLMTVPFVAHAQQPTSEPFVERVRLLGPVRQISLRNAIDEALKQNLNITIESYAVDTSQVRLWGARGFYDPSLGLTVGRASSVTPSSSLLDAGANASSSIPTETAGNFNFGPTLLQNLPGGGVLNLGFVNRRNTSDNAFSFVNPSFNSDLSVSFTQPLWRGFRDNAIHRQLRVLQIDTNISESQFRQAVSDVVFAVHQSYWNLVFALETHEARRQSRDLALVQQSNTRNRVDSGLLTPVALTSARAEVALREQDVIQAEVDIARAENGLRQLLAPSPAAAVWQEFLVPTDRPVMQELDMTLPEAVDRAVKNRPEIEQVRLQLTQNNEDRKYLKNETRPTVNLLVTAGSIGQSGVIYEPIFGDTGIAPIGRVELKNNPGYGGYSTSWRQLFGVQFPNWSLGLNVQIPIGNRQLRSQLQEAQISAQKLETQAMSVEQAIIVEVRNSFETLQLQKQSVEAARVARELSEEQLTGESERFRAGLTTNFEVLRYQRDLTDARVRELRTLVEYQLAISALQRATDAIIDANDLVLASRK